MTDQTPTPDPTGGRLPEVPAEVIAEWTAEAERLIEAGALPLTATAVREFVRQRQVRYYVAAELDAVKTRVLSTHPAAARWSVDRRVAFLGWIPAAWRRPRL